MGLRWKKWSPCLGKIKGWDWGVLSKNEGELQPKECFGVVLKRGGPFGLWGEKSWGKRGRIFGPV